MYEIRNCLLSGKKPIKWVPFIEVSDYYQKMQPNQNIDESASYQITEQLYTFRMQQSKFRFKNI